MLKTILSVSGKPGLYKLVSNGKNMIIVESLVDNRKLPIYARDKVVSLGDISIYTDTDEVPLREVLVSIKKKENGAKASIATSAKPEELKKFLEEVLPNFDRERVYPTDIKKMIGWYNILVAANVDFEADEKAEEGEEKIEETKSEGNVEEKAAKVKKSADDKNPKETKTKVAAKTEKPKTQKNTSTKASTSSKAAKTATPRKTK